MKAEQAELFSGHTGPPGFVYQADYLSPEEEAGLLDEVARLTFVEARYRDFTARRRIVSWGPEDAKPEFLRPLARRARPRDYQGRRGRDEAARSRACDGI